MRLSRLAPLAIALLSQASFAQAPVNGAPAAEPAPPAAAPPSPPAPTPPAAPPAARPPSDQEQPAAPAPAPPEPAPRVEVAPPPAEPAPPVEIVPAPEPPPATPEPPAPVGPAPVVASTEARKSDAGEPAPGPWRRAREPLTLEASFGVVARPQGSDGFHDESQVGSVLGASLYWDLKREIAAGLEIERASLGRGTAMTGLDSASVDYTVSSAMLGVRAYPLRTDFVDLFVGLQVGVGVQGISATGTESNGPLLPASAYTCGGADTPAFQLGGGVGARLMLSERWGVSARINGAGRRMTGDRIDECARGLGTATTISGSLGLGYDFELDR